MIIKNIVLSDGIRIKYVQYPKTVEEHTREHFTEDQKQALSNVALLLSSYVNQNQIGIEKITFRKVEQQTEATGAVQEIDVQVSYRAQGGTCFASLNGLTDDKRTLSEEERERRSIPGLMEIDLIEAVDALYKQLQRFAEGTRQSPQDLFTADKAS